MLDPWQWWSPETIARVTGCPVVNVREHWPRIARALAARGLWARPNARGVLATVAIETASTFTPLHEFGTPADWSRYSGGPAYAGRGFIQLTHDYGYRAAGQALGIDLLADPDRAMEPAVAADILAWFWASKLIPSKDGSRVWTLTELCREGDTEWIRRAVQGGTAGLDRLRQIWRDLGDVTNVTNMLRVTEDGVRLRARPDTQAPILYEARAGETVEPVTDHAWRNVRAGGRTGWMAAEYLRADADPTQSDTQPPTQSVQGESTNTAYSNILSFDPHAPTELQRQDWTCSIRSVMWLLKSLGIQVTPEEAQDAMAPRYVRSDVGLLDPSGAGLVEVLRDRWGVGATNNAAASFDDVLAVAGRQPVMMGGRAWNHWTAVRGWDGPPGMERLLLANPGGTGPRYGQQTLNRQQFADLGPFSAVVVPLGA